MIRRSVLALLALLTLFGCKGATSPPGLLMPQKDLSADLVREFGTMPDLDGGAVAVYELDFSDGTPPGRLKARWWSVTNPSTDAGVVTSVELELIHPAPNQLFTKVTARANSDRGAIISYLRMSGVDQVGDGKGGWTYPNASPLKNATFEGRDLAVFPDGRYLRNIQGNVESGQSKPEYVNGLARERKP